MKLLGGWNWYLPKRLEWLPTLSHGEEIPEQAGAGPRARRPRQADLRRSRPPRRPDRARPRGRNPDQFGRSLLGFPKSWRPETSSSAVATPATAGVA